MKSTVARLLFTRNSLRRLQIQNRRIAAAQERALIRRGQITVAPRRRAALHPARGIGHHHERRHVLVLRAQPVGRPRAEARPAHQNRAGVHLIHRLRMRDAVGVTAAQQTNVVRVARDVRQEIRNLDAGLPALLKRTQRREQFVLRNCAPRFESAERFGNRLARETNQFRFRIEQIHVARPTRHEEEDDALAPSPAWAGFRRERIGGRVRRSLRAQATQCRPAAKRARAFRSHRRRAGEIAGGWCRRESAFPARDIGW